MSMSCGGLTYWSIIAPISNGHTIGLSTNIERFVAAPVTSPKYVFAVPAPIINDVADNTNTFVVLSAIHKFNAGHLAIIAVKNAFSVATLVVLFRSKVCKPPPLTFSIRVLPSRVELPPYNEFVEISTVPILAWPSDIISYTPPLSLPALLLPRVNIVSPTTGIGVNVPGIIMLHTVCVTATFPRKISLSANEKNVRLTG